MTSRDLIPHLATHHHVASLYHRDGTTDIVATDHGVIVHGGIPRALHDHELDGLIRVLIDARLARIARCETGDWE